MSEVLTSEWGGLNPHLLATFWEVDRNGKPIGSDVIVQAPLSESNLSMTQNWQSPFENVGQSNLPTLQQLLQSGAGLALAGKADAATGADTKKLLALVEGKSSVTKLNSTQVWSGSPPAKWQITAVFRAWKDPKKEVEDPVDQLAQWHLPKYLAKDGILLSGLDAGTVFPSTVPSILAIKYKNRTYSPVVIESFDYPTNSPINADGEYVELSVPMTIATLTSIDVGDWKSFSNK
ncbi:MAG: hypothetical protein M0Q44_01370 [Methylobacter sp.]|jgi:hypothetical protein|nr:hypothetical protein [Methylobacter sp.]